jgi:hypothetical protein
MLVTLHSGPFAGETRHVERSQTTILLMELGLIEEKIVAPPAAITESQWSVIRLPHSGNLAINCVRPSGETVFFTKPPASYKAGLKHCDSNCPLEVLAEYARRFGTPEVAGNYEAMMAQARAQQKI